MLLASISGYMWVIANSIFWTSLGALLWRYDFIPVYLPQLLGKSLYWLGIPLQIFFLARRSHFSQEIWLPCFIATIVMLLGWSLANISLNSFSWREIIPQEKSSQGSFVLSSILGNTGFVGLAIAPALVDRAYWSWIVIYGVTHNVFGSYGLGVILASYFSKEKNPNNFFSYLEELLKLPSLWAFIFGYYSKNLPLPLSLEFFFNICLSLIIPGAFLLIGMQLSKLQGFSNFSQALIPTIIKILLLPGITASVLTLSDLLRDGRLALVLMSGMPAAVANAILAEEYNLDRELAASCIVLSTVLFPLSLFLWLNLV